MPFKRSQLQEALEAAIQASHPSQAGVSAWDRPLGNAHEKLGKSWEDPL